MPIKSKYLVSDEVFINAVKESFSIAEALRKIGLSPFGSSYRQFRIRVKKLLLDTSHFMGQGHLKGKTHNWTNNKMSLEEVLIEDSDRSLRVAHKKRLFAAGFLKEECTECHLGCEWQDKPITLQIDHINGNPFDHRIENLRILCPNCHSQTSNFGSKNDKGRSARTAEKEGRQVPQRKKNNSLCGSCEKTCRSGAKYCQDCWRYKRKELKTYTTPDKIVWPSVEALLKRLETMPFTRLAKELGVSDNAIRKRIKNAK